METKLIAAVNILVRQKNTNNFRTKMFVIDLKEYQIEIAPEGCGMFYSFSLMLQDKEEFYYELSNHILSKCGLILREDEEYCGLSGLNNYAFTDESQERGFYDYYEIKNPIDIIELKDILDWYDDYYNKTY